LENKRAEQVLSGNEGVGDIGDSSRGEGKEVAQTMYTNMNKCKNKKWQVSKQEKK
jgi:hypothetical protein